MSRVLKQLDSLSHITVELFLSLKHCNFILEHFVKNFFFNAACVERSWVIMAEWLRRWTRNPLGSPRAGSNPADYVPVAFSLTSIGSGPTISADVQTTQ